MIRHAILVAGALVAAAPLAAQGHGPKRYTVTTDRAVLVTKDVLVKQGYDVIKIEQSGDDQIVWYRRGSMGRGKGKGPPMQMTIRRDPVANAVVFLNTPSEILVDIDVRLRIP